jgi:DNA-binding FrmR family transcriptional regulator
VNVTTFVAKWKASGASERANKDSFLRDLCDVLGVAHPDPKTGDPDSDHYVFERDVALVHDGAKHTIGFIDLYKRGAFILEAKQGSEAESKKIGTARRATPAWNIVMQDAFGQALGYAATIEPPPPFIIITDIGYCFDLYAAFDGTRNYRKFPDALSSRISLDVLERDPAKVELLRAIFTDPHALDPSKRSARVTREIAGHIATLSRTLEEAGHAPEVVAKFLMRCLFTMFAEDVDLLPKGIFAQALNEQWIENPAAFPGELGDLWKTMNAGGSLFRAGKIWKFNGGLFADPVALPLTKEQLRVLAAAAGCNWSDVEPAIFGTLLERALSPKERHSLGAHYTPRAYVERLVKPTIEEPLRAEWDTVRAQVQKLIAESDPDANRKAVAEAQRLVGDFYDRLTTIRVLDPACGSGNFLYVALDLFKRIENEALDLLSNLGDSRPLFAPSGRVVTPEQFLGIEIKPWAKEITELVLWIGFLQWQIRTRGWKSHPTEPILRDYHNIECRDAVLAYDRKEPLLGDDGKPVTRWDGETMKLHPVTGEEVPDESAQVPVYRYVNPRKAEWPAAEFIVGNPPFVGGWRMRSAFGDGYVEALWSTFPEMPEKADFVMYWWEQAANRLRTSGLRRFGLITTNSITQVFQRRVLESHLSEGASIVFAVPDHPWVDAADGAAVRIAMTVTEKGTTTGRLLLIRNEREGADGICLMDAIESNGQIHADLTIGAAVVSAKPLRSNDGITSPGVQLYGDGFIVASDVSGRWKDDADTARQAGVLRRYLNGKDLMQTSRDVEVIDFFGYDEERARLDHPALYQHVLERVKPERAQNRRESIRRTWWRFGWERPVLRDQLRELHRFIVTPETAKHRVFAFLEAAVLPDNRLTVIASMDAFVLGVLSSRPHGTWAKAAGGTLEDRPVYTKATCFDAFSFPAASDPMNQRIRLLGEQLDAHRKRQQALHPDLTITGMYNVLEKLRTGEALTAKDKTIHEQGLVSVLKQIHDDLDAAVFDAYGWPHDLTDEQILERLVALNAERAEEEKRGLVRWLRPEFQNPEGTNASTQTELAIEEDEAEVAAKKHKGAKKMPAAATPWPDTLPAQIGAVRDLVNAAHGHVTADHVAHAFKGAKKKELAGVLDSLAALGLVLAYDAPDGRRWRRAGA